MLARLLPAEERGSNLLLTILREIIACKVLQPALSNADPDTINYGINYLLGDPAPAAGTSTTESDNGDSAANASDGSAAVAAGPTTPTAPVIEHADLAKTSDASNAKAAANSRSASLLPVRPAAGADFDGLRPGSSISSAPTSGSDAAWRYFAGPISRADAESLLGRAPLGSFLLRSKEGGTVVLSYVTAQHAPAFGVASKDSDAAALVVGARERSMSEDAPSAVTSASKAIVDASHHVAGHDVRHTVMLFDGNFSFLQRGHAATLSGALRSVRDVVWIGAVVKTCTSAKASEGISRENSLVDSTIPPRSSGAVSDAWTRFSVQLEALYCELRDTGVDEGSLSRRVARQAPASKYSGIFGTSKRFADRPAGVAIAAVVLGRPANMPATPLSGADLSQADASSETPGEDMNAKQAQRTSLFSSLSPLLNLAVAKTKKRLTQQHPSTAAGSAAATGLPALDQLSPSISATTSSAAGEDWSLDLDSDGEAELDDGAALTGQTGGGFSSDEGGEGDGDENEEGDEGEEPAAEETERLVEAGGAGRAASSSMAEGGAGSADEDSGAAPTAASNLPASALSISVPRSSAAQIAPVSAPAAPPPRRKIFDADFSMGDQLFGSDVTTGEVDERETNASAAVIESKGTGSSSSSDEGAEGVPLTAASLRATRDVSSTAVGPRSSYDAAAARGLQLAKQARRWKRSQVRTSVPTPPPLSTSAQRALPCRCGVRRSSGRPSRGSWACLRVSTSSSSLMRGGRPHQRPKARRPPPARLLLLLLPLPHAAHR